MLIDSTRSKDRREGQKEASYILSHRSDVFSIHYSCESFNAHKSTTPRVTSVSIYNLSSGEQKCFSLHNEAQIKRFDCDKLSTIELDASERSLLQKFYRFVKANQGSLWIHWNMRNSKYGFCALDLRHKILTNRSAPVIKMQHRHNLYALLEKLYGPNFEADKYESKLLGLAQRNSLSIRGLMLGKEEANAFAKKEFQAVMESSQGKSEAIALLTKIAGERTLKVNASFKDIYGLSVQGVLLFIGDNFVKIWKIASALKGGLGLIPN